MTTISIRAVGDIMLGDGPISLGFGVNSLIKSKGSQYLFRNVKKHLRNADLVFGNLESPLSDNDSKRTFNSKIMIGVNDSVKGLNISGFNIMSLSNNHILQHGIEIAKNTQEILNKHCIDTVGFSSNIFNSHEKIVRKKGMTLAFLAYCLVPDVTGFSYTKNIEKIKSNIALLSQSSDHVIVSLHWGDEYIFYPTMQQISIAHGFIDSGASIILGHHPHIFQPIESYKGGLIAYSLGNFIFDFTFLQNTRYTAILNIILEPNGIKDFSLTPFYIDDEYSPVYKYELKRHFEDLNLHYECLRSTSYVQYQKRYDHSLDKVKKINEIKRFHHVFSHITDYEPLYLIHLSKNYLRKLI